MNQVTPFDTWGRSRQPGGGTSKWHLISELRRSTGLSYALPAGALFAVSMCAQALPEPEWGPAQKPRQRWQTRPRPLIPGSGAVCSSCLDLLEAQIASVPA